MRAVAETVRGKDGGYVCNYYIRFKNDDDDGRKERLL